jgi:hypothetical protein
MAGIEGFVSARGLNGAGLVGIVNACDHGVYGDNVHDDGAALANLFSAAPSTGMTVILPPATYSFATAVTVPASCTLVILGGVTINTNQPTAAAGGQIIDWRNPTQAGSNVVHGGQEADLFGQSDTIASGEAVTLDVGYQAVAYGTHTINGTLTINGTFRVVAWPT